MRYHKRNRKKLWTGTLPFLIFIAASIYMLDSYGITKDTIVDAAAGFLQTNLGYQTVHSCMPFLTYDASQSGQKTIYDYLAAGMDELLPIYGYAREQNTQLIVGNAGLAGEAGFEESCDSQIDALTGKMLLQENQSLQQEEEGQQSSSTAGESGSSTAAQSAVSASGKVQKFSREKLNDFDYLLQNFYRVDSTTTTNGDQLNAKKMLAKDMSIDKDQKGTQILIYHTHSQERFADSKDASQSVVALGDILAELLEGYGYTVMHHKGVYDLPDRDTAYSRAAPALEKLFNENPEIQVSIDLHRDAVAEGTHLVQKINGKDTASIMFFNGLSHTTDQGDIGYLYNPNLEDNLAFSFQMQLAASEYYPGLSRCIYLRGYRYNLHYLPRSLLVEAGAQTNTYQEVVNAMAPLADVLDKVLSGETRQ